MIRLLRTAIWIGAAVGVVKAVKSIAAHGPAPKAPAFENQPSTFETFTAEEQDLLMREMDASF
ncbi:MAG: hypothetical protein RhofKO_40160 [Rhodothermales bacterium]